jgi:hypothetical protein
MFYCPGCKTQHGLRIGWEFPGPHAWGWNRSDDKPTFTPSVLVTGTDFTEKGEADYEAWCAAGHPSPAPAHFESRPTRCHSFVTDGRIQFLGDCTHALANQTVDLPPID